MSNRVIKEMTVQVKDIMSKPLIFLTTEDTIRRASSVLLDHRISGAPVLDSLERPVGVLTKTDIARYERERLAVHLSDKKPAAQLETAEGEPLAGQGFQSEDEEDLVSYWMAPNVFAIGADATLAEVIQQMIRKHVHRIFVKDEENGELTGVITTFDVLRLLGRVLMVTETHGGRKQETAGSRS